MKKKVILCLIIGITLLLNVDKVKARGNNFIGNFIGEIEDESGDAGNYMIYKFSDGNNICYIVEKNSRTWNPATISCISNK